jgi:hypothetical protein
VGGIVVVVENGDGVGAGGEPRGDGAQRAGGAVFGGEGFAGDLCAIDSQLDGEGTAHPRGRDEFDGNEFDLVDTWFGDGEGVGDFAASFEGGDGAIGIGEPVAGDLRVGVEGGKGYGCGSEVVGNGGVAAVEADFLKVGKAVGVGGEGVGAVLIFC